MPLLRRHIREERSINESNQHNQYGPSLESSLAPALILAPAPPPRHRQKQHIRFFPPRWASSRIGPFLAGVHGRDGRRSVICPDWSRKEESGPAGRSRDPGLARLFIAFISQSQREQIRIFSTKEKMPVISHPSPLASQQCVRTKFAPDETPDSAVKCKSQL